ncbi:MAG: carbonic anhydrase [Spirochaetota bacterium]
MRFAIILFFLASFFSCEEDSLFLGSIEETESISKKGKTFKNRSQKENKTPLQLLLDGNIRYTEGHLSHPHESQARRMTLSKSQHPFAVIITCADSRVVPEIMFDQGIGDLFVIRVAGNIIDEAVLGSIEYAVEHLSVKLIMVLGHERCGAVTAALTGKKDTSNILFIANHIKPAIERAKRKAGNLLDNSVRENVIESVELVKKDQNIIADAFKHGDIRVVGARYDLDDGKVEIIY